MPLKCVRVMWPDHSFHVAACREKPAKGTSVVT